MLAVDVLFGCVMMGYNNFPNGVCVMVDAVCRMRSILETLDILAFGDLAQFVDVVIFWHVYDLSDQLGKPTPLVSCFVKIGIAALANGGFETCGLLRRGTVFWSISVVRQLGLAQRFVGTVGRSMFTPKKEERNQPQAPLQPQPPPRADQCYEYLSDVFA